MATDSDDGGDQNRPKCPPAVVEEGFEHSYDSVKRYVRRLKKKVPEVFARLHTAPGEEAQVDFGEGAPTLKNGRYKRPWLFKIVLSHSRHSYEEVVWGQDVETFIRCHERAFDALGGVPRIVILHNLKSGVLKANLYEPDLLIIDEFGMRKLPANAAEDLLEVFHRRYHRGPNLIATNRPLEDWGKLLDDTAAASAMLAASSKASCR